MRIRIDGAHVYDPVKKVLSDHSVLVADGKIVYVGPQRPEAESVYQASGRLLSPGFVDVHTHGRIGIDFLQADSEGLARLAKSYASVGTTTVMPTLASATPEELAAAADRIRQYRYAGGARFIGIHLEGRYINLLKRGAHAPGLIKDPDPQEMGILLPHLGHPCHITAAWELDRGGVCMQMALRAGATLALGHTCATYEQTEELIEKGVTAFTHLFNAMPQLHHREGGCACAAINSEGYIELICDGIHVSPGMIKMAYRAHDPDRFVLVTDSIEAAGMPDGRYEVAGSVCRIENGRVMTEDGVLAGSMLGLNKAVVNLKRFCGLSLEQALYHATLAPALEVGIADTVGTLEVGKKADIVIGNYDRNLDEIGIERVMVDGTWVE